MNLGMSFFVKPAYVGCDCSGYVIDLTALFGATALGGEAYYLASLLNACTYLRV